MTTAQMRYFIEVARCLSFTKAADRLFISQPALSRHISQMESELNVQLFLRLRNTVSLTPAGQALLEGLERVYEDYEQLVEQVRAANAGFRGELKLGLLEGQLLPGKVRLALHRFSQSCPGVRVRLSRHSFRALRELLMEGGLDLIVSLQLDVVELPWAEWTEVEKAPMCLAVESGDPLAQKNEIAPEEFPALLREKIFFIPDPADSGPAARTMRNTFARFGFQPRYSYAPSADLLSLWVAAGQGVSLLNRNHVLAHDPNVRLIPIRGFSDSVMAAAWLPEGGNPAVPLFLDALEA